MMHYTIQNPYLKVTASERGAELQSILGADGTQYLWQGDPQYWNDRALNIFPYVARLTRESYYMDGELHHMKIHGIAPYQHFSAANISATQMTFELCTDAQTYSEYPRQFVFHVEYKLVKRILSITYRVRNMDNRKMFFGLGGHPGFNVPLSKGLHFEDYRLRFDQAREPIRIGFTEDCFLNGKYEPFVLQKGGILDLQHELFDHDAIVLKHAGQCITLESEKDYHSISVTFPQMKYLSLWHWPKTDAPYICIEPWCSLPSAENQVTIFESQPDLLVAAPGETYVNTWSIAFN